MDDADPRLSKAILAGAVVGAGLNLAASTRARGPRRAAVLFALATGLPAAGELLATGPLGLLRHRLRPRVAGVPLAVLLGWYSAVAGSLGTAELVLARFAPERDGRQVPDGRKVLLPALAAAVGTSLDLILDPYGLAAGLWEWSADGAYAREVAGPNGRRGVPLVNYAGWVALVSGTVYLYGIPAGDDTEAVPSTRPDAGSRSAALLLLPPYLAAATWAARRRKPRYLAFSALFPAALYTGLRKR